MKSYSLFFQVIKNKIERKPVLPDCRKCVNYVPYKNGLGLSLSEILDTCKKFERSDNNPNVNLKYESIGKCRENETKCGQLGKLFVSKEHLPIIKK